MSEDWTVERLGDVIVPCGTIDPTKEPDRLFRYIDVSSVSNETFEIVEAQTIQGREAPSRARRLVRSGDVIFATIRPTLKRIAVVPPELDGEVCSTGYFVFRPHRHLDGKFLYYYLFTDGFLGAMEALQTGASYPAVNDAQVKDQKIVFPSLPEQKRIVAILDEAFAGIAAATANAEKNLANARELFNGGLEDAFSETKAGRKLVTLTELTTDITDGDHMPPPKSPTGVPFITISNIHKGTNTIDFSDTFKVPRVYFDNLKPNKKPQLGDVLYTVTGSFGIPVIVQDSTEFCFQRHIGLVRPKRGVDSKWLYYALLSPPAFKQAADGATGTAQKTVSLKVLRSLQLPDIPLAEQVAMTSRLDALYARTKSLESVYTEKLASILDLKQTLLQKAFTGELTGAKNRHSEAA
ncbi:MAG: hypothetical protein B7Z57_10530 [Acidiphilium sp. 37-60-79]|nr:MAG: hypothetical protein B7Z57_10530 [Acidiphilium sp. 37-60-79]